MTMIHCRIVTPQGFYKEMDTPIVNIETTDGARGILPEHMPIVTTLKIGKMTTEENGQREEYAVAGGLFYFRNNMAELMTDAIENKRDIDIDRAEAAKARAERRLSATDRNYDLRRAEIALQKALNRLNVKGQ